jgi:hypothetical protein
MLPLCSIAHAHLSTFATGLEDTMYCKERICKLSLEEDEVQEDGCVL